MRPQMPTVTLSRRAKIALWIAGAIVVLLVIGVRFAGVYVNWLWFHQAGFSGVYSKVLWTRVALFAIFGVLMALVIGGNLVIAYVLRPPFRPMSAEQQNLERYRVVLEPRRKLILIGISLIALFTAGMSAQASWGTWQLWLHGEQFGVRPIRSSTRTSRSIAWDYPVYRLLLSFGFTAIIFSLVLVLVVALPDRRDPAADARAEDHSAGAPPPDRPHLRVHGAQGAARTGSIATGWSSPTAGQVHRRVLHRRARSAARAHDPVLDRRSSWRCGVLASLWLKSVLLPAIGFVVLLVLSILISGIYPALVQQMSVKPNASSKEAPYIRRNIDATRAAYGIEDHDVDHVQASSRTRTTAHRTSPSTAASGPDRSDRERHPPPRPERHLADVHQQYQAGKNVYGFTCKLDIDRYTIDGGDRTTMSSVCASSTPRNSDRQPDQLDQPAHRLHARLRLRRRAGEQGRDDTGSEPGAYAEGGIPQTGALNLTQPRTYYGELLPDYSIVGTKGQPQEFDGNGDTKVSYTGSGGVSLSNFFTRARVRSSTTSRPTSCSTTLRAHRARRSSTTATRARWCRRSRRILTVDCDPYPFVDRDQWAHRLDG